MIRRDGLRILLGAMAAYCVGFSGWFAQPQIVSSLIRHLGLTEGSVGLVASSELLAVALTAFFLAPRIAVLPARRLCLCGAAVAVAGHALSAEMNTLPTLSLCRLLAGTGEGCVLAVANAVIASFRDPDRGYAQINVAYSIFGMALLSLLAFAEHSYGQYGMFIALSLVCLALLPAMLLMPTVAKTVGPSATRGFGNLRSYALLAGIFLYGCAGAAMWVFLLQIGARLGLEPKLIGVATAIWAATGLAGGVMAAWLSTRFGRIIPLTLALFVELTAAMAVTHASSLFVFMFATPFLMWGIHFITPYMFGIAAALDPDGRCAAAAGGTFTLTGAVGPLMGGLLTQWWGSYTILGWTRLVFILLTMLLVYYAAKGIASVRVEDGKTVST